METNKTVLGGVIVLLLVVIGGYLIWAGESFKGASGPATTTPLTSGENGGPPGSVHNQPVEPAAARAREHLAAELTVATSSIVIMRVEERTWNNGCLGLPRAGEFCTQALVEGFRVEMLAKGETYFYRTNKDGSSLRRE